MNAAPFGAKPTIRSRDTTTTGDRHARVSDAGYGRPQTSRVTISVLVFDSGTIPAEVVHRRAVACRRRASSPAGEYVLEVIGIGCLGGDLRRREAEHGGIAADGVLKGLELGREAVVACNNVVCFSHIGMLMWCGFVFG